jgi:HEPN domain-containing protein
MKKNNCDEAQRWFRQGNRDLESAKVNQTQKIYEVACFLCQQSAEKILKAFLYYHGEREIWGHSTLKLAHLCQNYNPTFISIENECKNLDKLYIPTRYPNGLPDLVPADYYTHEDATRAINDVEKIQKLVTSNLQFEIV